MVATKCVLRSVQQSLFGSQFKFWRLNLQIGAQRSNEEDCHSPFKAHFEHLINEDQIQIEMKWYIFIRVFNSWGKLQQ